MSFRFRLQKVLNYRDDQKKLAEEDLACCLRELLKVEREIETLQEEEQRLLLFRRGNMVQELNINTLKTVEGYDHYLKDSIQQKQQELILIQKEAEEKRQVLLTCWQGCQVLENLKEKNLHSFLEEEKKREQFINDEISLFIYNKRVLQ
jgi:flagellar FliJ protein